MKVITISNYNKEYLLKLLGSNFEQKIDVIRCGTDLNKFKYTERINKHLIKILFVGRLIEKKGCSCAIEAFKKVLEENHNIELRIIGDGPLNEEIEKLIQKLDLGGKVILLGAQPQSTVLKEMNEADIFFLPSLTAENGDREGIPVSIIEAAATGLPIVSTIHSGIPEIVIDGETGFLVQEKDTPAMAERLKQLILDPELRVKMGKAGRDRVETYYDSRYEMDTIERLFLNLIENKQLVSNRSEIQLATIRERIRNLGIQLSKLDDEIRVKTNKINEMNSELNRKDERIATLQRRLDEIENRPAYKVYIKMMSILKYIIDIVPR